MLTDILFKARIFGLKRAIAADCGRQLEQTQTAVTFHKGSRQAITE